MNNKIRLLFLSLVIIITGVTCKKKDEKPNIGNLQGVVKTTNGLPIKGAKVSLENISEKTTGDDGSFYFEDITPNTYSITISKTDFITFTDKVTIAANNTIAKNFILTLERPITITNPTGNVIWNLTTTQNITWEASSIQGNVKIELVKDNNVICIIEPTTDNDGVYTWQIPSNIANTSGYKVKISSLENTNVFDESDSFSIAKLLSLPTLNTIEASNIKYNEAMSGGIITSNGGDSITARGVCWATNHNPTINDFLTNDNSQGATNTFNSLITGLNYNTVYYARAYATNKIGTSYGAEISFKTNVTFASITTNNINSVTANSASCGGVVSNNGGSDIIEKGVCWSTSQNPTIANNKTMEGSGNNNFTSTLSNLLSNTTYYVRAYATNSVGTSYGSQVFFHTAFKVGDVYQGGKVAYIFEPGENGYVAGEIHGIIVATEDQSNFIAWSNGLPVAQNVFATAIGTGSTNTTEIINIQGNKIYAAKVCRDYRGGDYSDWFLPSKDELLKICNNKDLIGGFTGNSYWSSSRYSDKLIWLVRFNDFMAYTEYNVFGDFSIRAARYF